MKSYYVLAILFLGSCLTFGQVSLEKIELDQGTFQVGFRHYTTADSTRTYQRKNDFNNQFIPRPISISIWYPANLQEKKADQLTILNYLEVLKEEEEWEYLPNEHILNWFDYLKNTPENKKHLKEKVQAFYNSNYAEGRFPVIVYAPGYQASSIENFGLFEFLASNGYIVISSPSRGTNTRWLEGGTTKDMETQARDIEFLIKEAVKIPEAADGNIATMGFSFGGLSNVLAQMRNKNIKAIVSLDGTIKYNYPILQKSSFADLKSVDVPFIHLAQKDIPENVLMEDNISPELNDKFEFF